MFELLFILLLGHAVADLTLQSDTMGKSKNRNRQDFSNIPPGQKLQLSWPFWLTAHASTHALMVYFITGLWFFAACELIAHWTIDFCKCDNLLTMYQDQSLHALCKVLWIIMLSFGWYLK